MKKLFAAALSLIMAFAALTACSDKGSSSQGVSSSAAAEQSQAESKASSAPAGKEPDVMASALGEGGSDFIGMTKEQFDDATGGSFTKDNAVTYDESGSEIYAEYSLGKSSSILGGRVALPAEHEITTTVNYKDSKLKKLTVRVENVTKEEADTILDSFLKAFDGKLPKGYEQFTPVEHGKKKEVGFTKTKDDLIYSMTRNENLDGEIYVFFAIENYAERYNMK